MSLTEELQNDLTRNAEKKEQLVQSCGLWIQRREEARREQDAARLVEDASREAVNAFKMISKKSWPLKEHVILGPRTWQRKSDRLAKVVARKQRTWTGTCSNFNKH